MSRRKLEGKYEDCPCNSSGSNDDCEKYKCCRGPRGQNGQNGQNGKNGKNGKDGKDGPAGGGAVIPFASGEPIRLQTRSSTNPLTRNSAIGFGVRHTGIVINPFGGPVDPLFGTINNNMVFIFPRSGTLTSIWCSLRRIVSDEGSVAGTVTVVAILYTAPINTDVFNPVPGATVPLAPTLSGVIPTDLILSGKATGLSIPIIEGNQYVLIVTTQRTDIPDGAPSSHINGYFSAGISIE